MAFSILVLCCCLILFFFFSLKDNWTLLKLLRTVQISPSFTLHFSKSIFKRIHNFV